MLTKEPNTLPLQSRFFTEVELSSIDKKKIPFHIAIIPDGNRRWANDKTFAHIEGHKVGADTIMDAVKAAKDLGIKIVTFYIFSTENWARSKEEVDLLMWLLHSYLQENASTMIENEVRFETIGSLEKIPDFVLQTIQDVKKQTENCRAIDLIFAVNYGGRDEIKRALCKIIDQMDAGQISRTDISEELISQFLDTSKWQDPDLLIRTGGELRLSNFLLWEISYTEIYIANVLWPNFTPHHLLQALQCYQSRNKRLGGP